MLVNSIDDFTKKIPLWLDDMFAAFRRVGTPVHVDLNERISVIQPSAADARRLVFGKVLWQIGGSLFIFVEYRK